MNAVALLEVVCFSCFSVVVFLRRILAVLLVLVCGSVSAIAGGEVNLGKDKVALQGYDPVSYFRDKGPVLGLESLVWERDGAIYRFATEKNRSDFMALPETYEPAFGGWCAWAMLEGDEVEVDPLAYRIYEGKLLVFYNGFWGDTKEKWQKRAKRETESKLFGIASSKWDELTGER